MKEEVREGEMEGGGSKRGREWRGEEVKEGGWSGEGVRERWRG